MTLEQEITGAGLLESFDMEHHDETVEKGERLVVSGAKILAVDDNNVNLHVIKNILSLYGIDADTATGGREAIGLCSKKNYDMVFMDQMMPEIDGIEAMQKIRREIPHYRTGGEGKIIALTADAIDGVRETLLGKGFDEYLSKPVDTGLLEKMLAAFLPKECVRYVKKDAEKQL